jgi:hypothetical protein
VILVAFIGFVVAAKFAIADISGYLTALSNSALKKLIGKRSLIAGA